MERISDRTCPGGFTASGVRTVYGSFAITRSASKHFETTGVGVRRGDGMREARSSPSGRVNTPTVEGCGPPKRFEAA